MKYDKNIVFPFVKFSNKHKEGSGYCLLHHGGPDSLWKCKEYVQEHYDLAHICISIDISLFEDDNVVP